MEEEVWKPIEGYENYQVSNLGRVRSLNYRHTGETRVLKASEDNRNYLVVSLWKNGIQKVHKVHRLVANAFIENPDPDKNCIDHINTIRTDNRVENLHWVNHHENSMNELTRQHMREAQKGKIISEEQKRKISEARKGKYCGENSPMYGKHHSEQARKKISEANKGKHRSEEFKRKISESNRGENHPMFGRHHSEETRRKMSEASKGKRCGKNNPNSKRVEIFREGVSLGVFPYIRELERQSEKLFGVKLYADNISQVCAGKKEKYKGFTFRFI